MSWLTKLRKIKSERVLRLAMLGKMTPDSLITVTNDKGDVFPLQLVGILKIVQESKGWYYNDPERDTVLITYVDNSWVRLEISLSDLSKQLPNYKPFIPSLCLEL